ncbi:MAG: GAF domain-containing protein [Pseudomonadota bacterium]
MQTHVTVLLADPDQRANQSLQKIFAQRGWKTVTATSLPETQSVAADLKPDAILLSALPTADQALQLITRLRSSISTANLPIVVLGKSSPADRETFLQGGAQDYLGAPFDSKGLCDSVLRQIEKPLTVASAPENVLHDAIRLSALKATGLLDSPPERSFDRLAQLVSKLLGAPTALLSLVDSNRQFFKGHVGLSEVLAGARETPLSHSFCQWAVSGREQIIVADAREHPVLKNNLAIQDMGVVAYAGLPVSNGQGQALGSLCAIDAKPRTWSANEIAILGDITKLAESCIAQAELARHPPKNASGYDRFVETSGEAISAAVRILQKRPAALDAQVQDMLLQMIDEYGVQLVQLNRMIQVVKALQA